MAKTSVACPRCRQPVIADIEQLFDMGTDSQAKQKLLSGMFNVIQCPSCGYAGQTPRPLVYHDPQKELLLTYFPPELGLPVNEQERLIGPLINQVVNNLPLEKRKAYLLRPQSMFTFETLIEKVLEADGVTKEMLDNQQKRLSLIQRLLNLAPEARAEVIKQEENLIDNELFSLLGRVFEIAIAQGDQQGAQAIALLQKDLIEQTAFGQQVKQQNDDAEAAIQALQQASKDGLTHEKLLDIFIAAKSDVSLSTLVSMARPGMDYTFFELLTNRIDAASGEEKQRLTALREKLLSLTERVDKVVQERLAQAKEALEQVLNSGDLEKTILENTDAIDDFFMEALRSELHQAQTDGNIERSAKLKKLVEIIQKLSQPPAEYALVEELLSAEDQTQRQQIMETNSQSINADFLQILNGLVMQSEKESQPAEVQQELKDIYRMALRFSMQNNLTK
ncbi:hypothetical protein ADN00_11660 [Ornatilinea apprima]|uniref:CpXC domain-containing protein n=1 Tax=Ornatilinea apprima TaxID=1134406 RepID=A0A0P6X117_9CHLR|nr:CpXC domain-containing protein [Ornatilinea apprima]KPL76013.1 hypothetical protein ADN00_11660 [Ornatilinea apprima]